MRTAAVIYLDRKADARRRQYWADLQELLWDLHALPRGEPLVCIDGRTIDQFSPDGILATSEGILAKIRLCHGGSYARSVGKVKQRGRHPHARYWQHGYAPQSV